ncbi:macro domain-containing protein [Phycicoccus endophyticus]|uniref:Macro domain-containing protein n=1 Tax=Phycicoccus endophyticus TaxID=1690220 RepID=A0A7G9R5H0_9MICO|nr:macro domain-containing protein [Phycicoccus endophyticus]QNN50845.1 macro domain-containing protein [Phycicoccus endophyticus]GGL34341.1 O-acetyl-ADP-ribose deacetylase [Phycicoccus endophyticus]
MVEAVRGDLTTQRLDVVVNAADPSLLGGGGVDGALHAAAGPGLLQECRRLRRTTHPDGLTAGEAVATGASNLPCRWVVHTVGPNRHRGQSDPALLAACLTNSLAVARGLGARTVGVPAVSAGAFGWDPTEVAGVLTTTAAADVRAHPGLDLVRFVLTSERLLSLFQDALERARR